MNKISVVINTYNAKEHLKEVLESVKMFDEIVVCDMESTDNTVSIAQEYGCKVVTFEKKDYVSAEPARTFAIQSASHEWVLVVDADELIPEDLRTYLYKRIQEPDCPAGLYIPRKNYFMNQFMNATYPDYQLRFFKREGAEWPPYVHTFPTICGTAEKISKRKDNLAIIHLSDPIVSMLNKMNQYTENEIIKRKSIHVSLLMLIFKPFARFFKSYFLKGGFRNGKAGFIQAVLHYNYKFFTLSKMVEKENNDKSKK